MNTSENKDSITKLDQQYKTLAKNTLFSIFLSYSTYLFTILNSFLIARMISREDWAILILAVSIIGIISIIISFIPPGLVFSMNFYIPLYRAKNETKKLRSFVLNASYLTFIISSVTFLIAIIFFSYFNSFYDLFLKNHIIVLYILSPLIIINTLNVFFSTFLIGFNLFKTNLIFSVIGSIANILPLFAYFFLFRTINIEIIALIMLISAIIPFSLKFLIFIIKIPKVKLTKEDGLKLKKFIKTVIGYGSFLTIETFINRLWGEVQTQAIGGLESPKWVTGNNISRNYNNSSSLFINSLTNPLIYSLSSLDYTMNYDRIINMFKTVFNYSLYMFLFIIGILFFLADFVLSFIYGENYVEYASLIKIMQISLVISIYPMLFGILLRTTNRIKLLAIITSIFFPLHVLLVFIGLFYYGIYGMYYAYILVNILVLICDSILTVKVLKVKLDFFKMVLQYFSYFIAIFLAIFLGDLIFNELSYQFWINSKLLIFKHLNLLNLLTFMIVFLLLNIIFKLFTKSDIEYIEMLFTKDTISHKFINKFLRLLKRFLR